MFRRIYKPLESNSFFLFGPRGTGKTTLLKGLFSGSETLWIDLLRPEVEDRYGRRPELLIQEIAAREQELKWVVIDEVQKLPRLLDVVHHQIEATDIKFALTGSSARKLKRGHANLLAGRAFINELHPLTHLELGEAFDLISALRWGTLPRPTLLDDTAAKAAFLQSYALSYLKEEIWAEHIIRKLDPFRRFLEVAAQTNGEPLNYTNIANDVGADPKTVQSYYQILEDTMLGFMLPAYHRSVRQQQRKSPKFYFFDPGVQRALTGLLSQELVPNTYGFGKAFEHWVLLEAYRFNSYYRKDYRFSYLRTKDAAEIDLLIERPGMAPALVEIKSYDAVDERSARTLVHFAADFPKAEKYIWSRDPRPKKIKGVAALPWERGLKAVGLIP